MDIIMNHETYVDEKIADIRANIATSAVLRRAFAAQAVSITDAAIQFGTTCFRVFAETGTEPALIDAMVSDTEVARTMHDMRMMLRHASEIAALAERFRAAYLVEMAPLIERQKAEMRAAGINVEPPADRDPIDLSELKALLGL